MDICFDSVVSQVVDSFNGTARDISIVVYFAVCAVDRYGCIVSVV
jgi:hypothetical protein